jgi:hypothetical protein
MTLLACLAFLIGVALCLRFNFLVLVPVIGVAMAGIAGVEIARGEGSLVPLTIVVTALQSGYLAGIVARALAASYAHASNRSHFHSAS